METTQKPTRKGIMLAIAAAVIIVAFGIGFFFGAGPKQAQSQADADESKPFGPLPTQSAEAPHATGMAGEQRQVASLGDLLPRLEAKVKENPDDLDQKVLLAQTYSELGQRDKAIALLRPLHKRRPKDMQIHIALATSLMESTKQAELKEAYGLLDDAVRTKPAIAPMARLYQGDILVKLGDKKRAVGVWRDYLKTMSPEDGRRQLFEQKIATTTGA